MTSAVTTPPGRAALIAVAIGLSVVAGCAPRAVPSRFSASTAASPEAQEAPSPRIGVALAEDPPLPGEPTGGWYGLEPKPSASASSHDHHHHHHHGPAPASPAPAGHDGHAPASPAPAGPGGPAPASPAPAGHDGPAPAKPSEPAHAH